MSDLFAIVSRYAELGAHRTGTPVDAATTDWLESLLAELGADVVRHPFTFSMFDGTAIGSGAADGVHLEPLYYSAVGTYDDQAACICSIGFDDDHGDDAIRTRVHEICEQARAAGATIAIAATLSASGGLCAINRAPAVPGDVAICLAPGHALAQLQRSYAGVRFQAELRTGRSENLTAFFPGEQRNERPLVITTPVSGWFACAGERGTGIAIAMSVAKELSRHVPVLLVLPSGHELGYLGAARFVETFDHPVRGVLHLGSCVADKVALARPGAMRAVSNLKGRAHAQVCNAFSPLHITPEQPVKPTSPEEWIGESELWAPRGIPMISMAGTSDLFHTPGDLPEAATSPELLTRVRSCVLAAAQALIR